MAKNFKHDLFNAGRFGIVQDDARNIYNYARPRAQRSSLLDGRSNR